MKILVVSQYYYPERFRVNDLCRQWVIDGHEVTVLTGIPNYPEGKFFKGYGWFKKRREEVCGVDIRRIPIIARGKSKLMLVLNYFSFVFSGWFFAKFTKLSPDVVFIYEVSPMTQAFPGIWLSKRRKIPCLLYIMDLWPENIEALVTSNKTILGLVGKMTDSIYNRSTKIFVSSRAYIDAIASRGHSREKLFFWPQYAEEFYTVIDPRDIDPSEVPEIPSDDIFNIVFAGNIAQAQGLEVLISSAEILRRKSVRVRFNLIGEGRAKAELTEEVKRRGLDLYFNFVPQKTAAEIPKYLAVCDAALLCLSSNKIFDMTIPAKLQSYLACAMPVIGCVSGESNRLINENILGLCCPSGDAEGLAEIIEKMLDFTREELDALRKNAVEYHKKHFEKEFLLKQFAREGFGDI